MTIYETRLDIKSWNENPYRELPDGSKFARAEVTLAGEAGAAGEGTALTEGNFEALLHYRSDGTSSYVTLMSFTGTVEGRSGRLVLAGDGGYDGTTARMRAEVIEATDDLAGLTGTVVSESTHEDYPHMPLTLTYELG